MSTFAVGFSEAFYGQVKDIQYLTRIFSILRKHKQLTLCIWLGR